MSRSFAGIVARSVLALGLFVLDAEVEWAAEPPLDASQYTVSCSTVMGTVSVKPSMVTGGTAPSISIRIKGTLDGCHASPPPIPSRKLLILPGSTFSGELTGTSNDCTSLLLRVAPFAGTLTIRWKTSPALVSRTTVISFPQQASVPFDAPWGASYVDFTLGGKTAVTGSFAGADGSGSSTLSGIYNEDVGALMHACDPDAGGGLKTLHIGLGALSVQ
jgi:hypothetical protein